MGRLDGKVALITGGGSGIGRASALLFAKEGARVVVANRSVDMGEETVKMIKAAGGEAMFVKTDVSKAADVERMVNTTVDTYGQLDILFNNAGIMVQASVVDMTEEDWDKVINVNLKGVFLGMKYGTPKMVRRGGVVINTSSGIVYIGRPNTAAYSASKNGIISLTKVAAKEHARNNIRINCICPGNIATPMMERRTGGRKEIIEQFAQIAAFGRLGNPEEIAEAALFLASDESSFVTGTVLNVDGGSLL